MSNRGENIRKNISAEYEKTPGYLLWDLSEGVGQEMDAQDEEIAGIRALFDVDNLTGEFLEKTVKQYKGLTRRAATYAVGEVEVTGNGTVAKGDLFETENGIQFSADTEVEITETGRVPITSVIPGNAGVVGANSITQMPVTIAGIATCTNPEPTHDGYDAESDDSLRQRYYAKLQRPDNGVNKYAYRNMALEVSGVGDADVYPLGHGENTVDIVIIDSDKLPASSSLVKTVQDYIDPNSSGRGEGTAQMGAHCYVSAATGMQINLTAAIRTTAEHTSLEEAIKASVKTYLASIAFAGTDVSYARINNAILETVGVLDIENLQANGGIANISVPERSVAILGTVVFTYA